MPRSLAGSRIREVRRRAKISQTELARRCGISASYLNLIEHNRRRIGGQVLNAIAEQLEMHPGDLDDGSQSALVSDLTEAAARNAGPDSRAPELAAQFPEWAQIITRMDRRLRDQQAAIAGLSDRLAHDPFLSENVHGMLSNITAIRSTASLLAQVEDIGQGQVRTFHRNLHSESVRLSDTAQGLADYLSRAGSPDAGAATAEEAMDRWLEGQGHSFHALDLEAETLSKLPFEAAHPRLDALIDDILTAQADPGIDAPARTHLHQYAQDAYAMPLHRFHQAAQTAGYDPLPLAQQFGQSPVAVFRRLAVLRRPWIEAPQFGLIISSASGVPLLRQPLPRFPLPRHGNACTLWPVFQAFSQPGQPVLRSITHDTGAIFTALALAVPRDATALTRSDLVAAMLLVSTESSPWPSPPAEPADVGTTCPICTRSQCPARTAPQLIPA
ncbi:short-chain fatty acyl-CoA regulator family protein [Halovulum sp. GXIMD14793]